MALITISRSTSIGKSAISFLLNELVSFDKGNVFLSQTSTKSGTINSGRVCKPRKTSHTLKILLHLPGRPPCFLYLITVCKTAITEKYASVGCFLLCLFPGYTALITETLAEVYFIFLLLLSLRLYQLSNSKSYKLLFYLSLSLLLLTKPIATYPVLIICSVFLIKNTKKLSGL